MKLGIISDLHLEFRSHLLEDILYGSVQALSDLGFYDTPVDALAVPGDIHGHAGIRDFLKKRLEDLYGVPVIMPLGNHDYWGGSFPQDPVGEITRIGDKVIASCTLWTYLSPLSEMIAPSFADFRYIDDVTPEKWNALYKGHLDFLRRSEADVIVTHHAPTYLSMTPGFEQSDINGFFMSAVDFDRFPKCRTWVHGHVHSAHDYTLPREDAERIRILCNPLGYPHERHLNARLKVVEV